MRLPMIRFSSSAAHPAENPLKLSDSDIEHIKNVYNDVIRAATSGIEPKGDSFHTTYSADTPAEKAHYHEFRCRSTERPEKEPETVDV